MNLTVFCNNLFVLLLLNGFISEGSNILYKLSDFSFSLFNDFSVDIIKLLSLFIDYRNY